MIVYKFICNYFSVSLSGKPCGRPNANEVTLMDMDKIDHHQTTTKHNTNHSIMLGIHDTE